MTLILIRYSPRPSLLNNQDSHNSLLNNFNQTSFLRNHKPNKLNSLPPSSNNFLNLNNQLNNLTDLYLLDKKKSDKGKTKFHSQPQDQKLSVKVVNPSSSLSQPDQPLSQQDNQLFPKELRSQISRHSNPEGIKMTSE